MSYIVNALGRHERLVLQARFPWLLHAFSWAMLIVFAILPLLGWVYVRLSAGPAPGLLAVACASAAVGFGVFTWLELYMRFTETAVTDQRFIIKRGIIARHATDFPLNALENVDTDQSIIARLFGFGRLEIAGSGDTKLLTPPMQDPVTFRTALGEARTALSDPPAFRAVAERIDPMRRENGPVVDARENPRQNPPRTTPLTRGGRRAMSGQAKTRKPKGVTKTLR